MPMQSVGFELSVSAHGVVPEMGIKGPPLLAMMPAVVRATTLFACAHITLPHTYTNGHIPYDEIVNRHIKFNTPSH